MNEEKRQPSSFIGHVERAMKHQARNHFFELPETRYVLLFASSIRFNSIFLVKSYDPNATVPMHVARATMSRRWTAVLSNVLRTCIYTHPFTDKRRSSSPCHFSICASAQSQRFAIAFRVTP